MALVAIGCKTTEDEPNLLAIGQEESLPVKEEESGSDDGEQGEENDSSSVVEEPQNGTDNPSSEQDPDDGNLTSESDDSDGEDPLPAIPVLSPMATPGSISSVSLTERQRAYNNAANRFAFQLLMKLYEEESVVFSPFSLQLALAMVAQGATGETLQEILDILGMGEAEVSEVAQYGKTLLEQFPALDANVTIQLANAIFVNDKFRLVPTFQDLMASCYYAPTLALPFDKSEAVKKAVNEWCKLSTYGVIPEILDVVSPSSMAYLLNTLYFKGIWTSPYDPNHSVLLREPFYSTGKEVKVDYLCSGEDLLFGDKETFQVVSRPFGRRGAYQMAIMLPKEHFALSDVIAECMKEEWTSICEQLNFSYIFLRVPRFETTCSYELDNTLIQLGIRRAFSQDAQFERMFEEGSACISRVFQKASFSLDENGVEAAGVTEVEMSATSPEEESSTPILFYADHPFAYIIYESTSGTILFMGVYNP